MRSIPLLCSLLLLLALAGCSVPENLRGHEKQLKYLPDEWHNIYFGMPLEEAVANRPDMEQVEQNDFRRVYLEPIHRYRIEEAYYYFDKEGEQPLYELILEFDSPFVRDDVAVELFGKPNYNDKTEWRYPSGEGFDIRAWTVQRKLVIVGMLPNTEWAEE